MPYFVADRTHLTSRAADIEDRMDNGQKVNRHARRFFAAFAKKCSKAFGGLR